MLEAMRISCGLDSYGNWTAWMANYMPPQCPSTTASMTKLTSDGRDEFHIGDSTVHFNIRPQSANAQAM